MINHKLVLSRHLLLEDYDKETKDRVIFNSQTGKRVKLSKEALKILEYFRTPCSTCELFEMVGVDHEKDRLLLKNIILTLVNENVLVRSSEEEQINIYNLLGGTNLVKPEKTFANCPFSKISDIALNSVAIIGIEIDFATTGKPGTRFGPFKIREASNRFISYDRDIFTLQNRGWFNADLNCEILKGVPFSDLGNIRCAMSENPSVIYDRCQNVAAEVFKAGAIPVFLGGDHSITAPLIKGYIEVFEDALVLIHFDAHTDLGEWSDNLPHHHGTMEM